MAGKSEIVFRRTKGRYDDCDPDMWDDCALIKSYDAAVSKEPVEMPNNESSQPSEDEPSSCADGGGEMVWSRDAGVIGEETQPKSKRKKNKRHKRKRNKQIENTYDDKTGWNVGDECMALYYEDGMYYRAEIVDIQNGCVIVNYIDYNEEETVEIGDVHPRHLWENAGIDLSKPPQTCVSSNDEDEEESGLSTENEQQPLPKKVKEKCPNTSSNRQATAPMFPNEQFFNDNHVSNQFPPPPPPVVPPFGTQFNNSQSSCKNCNCCRNNSLSKESLSSMLVSWYMAGYHTGYYRGVHSSMSKKCSKPS